MSYSTGCHDQWLNFKFYLTAVALVVGVAVVAVVAGVVVVVAAVLVLLLLLPWWWFSLRYQKHEL